MSAISRRRWLFLLIVLIVAVGLFAAFSASSLVALRSTAAQSLGFERDDYKLYPTAAAPQDFFGRVYTRARLSPVLLKSASSPDEASALVGFPVRIPIAVGMGALDPSVINGAHAYQVSVDLDEARRILMDSGLAAAELPGIAQDFQVNFELPTNVVFHQSQGERWYTLIESSPVVLKDIPASESANLTALQELHLRNLGLSPEDAQRFSREFGWADFFATPPTDLTHAELVSVSGASALLLSQMPANPTLSAVIWQADGTLCGLYGSLPPEELLQMAESLRTP